MAYDHDDAAWDLRPTNPTAHHVLLCLAHAACAQCGVTWIGVRGICDRTGVGINAVRQALAWLTREDFIRIHRYPKGGRGRSTEYIVLPQLVKLSTPLCGKCERNQNTHTPGVGYDKGGTDKSHTPGVGFSENPHGNGAETHLPGVGQQGITTQQGSALSRGPQEVATPPVEITPRLTDEDYAENVRMARELVASLSAQKTISEPKPREG